MPGSRRDGTGGTVLSIGFDDTDSPAGMCTTFLAYKAAGSLMRGGAEFLDFPRLVRLNPNIPWKTRGNGAVALRIRTDDPSRAKGRVRDLVYKYSDTNNGANPGLVFVEGDIPDGLAEFGSRALWQLVPRGEAKRLARRSGLEHEWMGNGQGLVGAMGAIGYAFGDNTLELLSYRRRSRFGTRRSILPGSVREMHEATVPDTFGSYDGKNGRVMIAPRGPDPVFYGIRGESAAALLRAAQMIRAGERPEGHMIFRTNQGTGDHLRNALDPAMLPHSSGTVSGTVSARPQGLRGGHVVFPVLSGRHTFWCAVYRPTGMAQTAARLIPGDAVRAGGGVRRASAGFPRVVNLEFLRIVRAAPDVRLANPACAACNKSMKSKGRGQGFECARCGARAPAKVRVAAPRGIGRGLYLPDESAHRHLARPRQRMGRAGRPRFDGAQGWFCVYKR